VLLVDNLSFAMKRKRIVDAGRADEDEEDYEARLERIRKVSRLREVTESCLLLGLHQQTAYTNSRFAWSDFPISPLGQGFAQLDATFQN
jgi:hypothetical protein